MVAMEQSPTTLYRVDVNLCNEELNVEEYTSIDLGNTLLGHLNGKQINILENQHS